MSRFQCRYDTFGFCQCQKCINHFVVRRAFVSLHKASDGTENLSTSPVETQTVDLSTDDTVVKATFSDSATFSAHDIIGISVNPTDNHGNVDLTIIFELEPF